MIHRESEALALLRGLSKDPCDLAFCPARSDVIAAVANDSNVYVYQLSYSPSVVTASVLLHASWGEPSPPSPTPGGGTDRLCFQPAAAPDVLATSLGGKVIQLWDLTTPLLSPSSTPSLPPPPPTSLPLTVMRVEESLARVCCFDFNPSGVCLVCGSADGWITAYILPSCEESFCVAAHDDAISLLRHSDGVGDVMISAGSCGYEIKLWMVGKSSPPECVRTMHLEQVRGGWKGGRRGREAGGRDLRRERGWEA